MTCFKELNMDVIKIESHNICEFTFSVIHSSDRWPMMSVLKKCSCMLYIEISHKNILNENGILFKT